MDRRTFRSNSCNAGKSQAAPPFSVSRTTSAPAATGAGSKDDAGERKALLPPPRRPEGGTARKGQKKPKRRVQWKDTHGKKLVEGPACLPSPALHDRGRTGDKEHMQSVGCASSRKLS